MPSGESASARTCARAPLPRPPTCSRALGPFDERSCGFAVSVRLPLLVLLRPLERHLWRPFSELQLGGYRVFPVLFYLSLVWTVTCIAVLEVRVAHLWCSCVACGRANRRLVYMYMYLHTHTRTHTHMHTHKHTHTYARQWSLHEPAHCSAPAPAHGVLTRGAFIGRSATSCAPRLCPSIPADPFGLLQTRAGAGGQIRWVPPPSHTMPPDRREVL